MDTLTTEQRSERMSLVRGVDSGAELTVRRIAPRMGFRYRKHRRDLPGRPDMVFAGRRKVVFVHGCFWHRHDCPAGRRWPKSHLDFWKSKLERNWERDNETLPQLTEAGWEALVIWECETRDPRTVETLLASFLDAQR
jgi:DNA mismatch endonuclease (patch repair protein)